MNSDVWNKVNKICAHDVETTRKYEYIGERNRWFFATCKLRTLRECIGFNVSILTEHACVLVHPAERGAQTLVTRIKIGVCYLVTKGRPILARVLQLITIRLIVVVFLYTTHYLKLFEKPSENYQTLCHFIDPFFI